MKEEDKPRTLVVHDTVGDALIATANFGPRYKAVEVGKLAPLIRKIEDLEGIARCGWLDPTNPIEVNLTYGDKIGRKLDTLRLTRQEGWLEPEDIIRKRPAIGYVPGEMLTRPYGKGMKYLQDAGPAAAAITAARLNGLDPNDKIYAKDLATDGQFWKDVAENKLYEPWLRELIQSANDLGINLIAPPVPVISSDLRSSPRLQMNLNLAVSRRWADPMDPDAPKRLASTRDNRLLYSLPVHPSAFDDPDLIDQAIRGMQAAIEDPGALFWGIHVQFPDWERFTGQAERVQRAKMMMTRITTYAASRGIFVWVCDAAPAGLSFLDLGASFVSYHPGILPRRAFMEGGAPKDGDRSALYGKILDLWRYGLVNRQALEANDWKLPATGYMPSKVPKALQEASEVQFRKDIQKPNNVAVQQFLTDLRLKELRQDRNHNPSARIMSQSPDDRFTVWGLQT